VNLVAWLPGTWRAGAWRDGAWLAQPDEPQPITRFTLSAGGFERRVAELRRAALERDDEDLLVILRAVLESGVMDG
jgi:hypothetical protein